MKKHQMRLARSQQQLWRICLALLVGTLLVSAVFFLVFRSPLHYQVLFFPDLRSGELSGERRMLPRLSNGTDAARQLVEEIILGPVDIQHSRVVPRSTTIRTIMLHDKVLYLDLSTDILHEIEDESAFLEIKNAFEHTIRFNYRTIREIVFTVDGQEPGATRYIGLRAVGHIRQASQ